MLLTLLFVVHWGSRCSAGWFNSEKSKEPQAEEKEFSLQMEEVVTVQLGQCALVPCSFSYPQEGYPGNTPAYGYWFREKTHVTTGFPVATNDQSRKVQEWNRGRFQLLGSPWSLSCSLLITEARATDKGWYFFRVQAGTSKQYSFIKNKLYLNVTALTQKPAIYVPETLDPGRQATAVCVFDFNFFKQCQAPTFSWTGAALSPQESSVTTAHVSVLTFTPRPQDHDTELTCRVGFSRRSVGIEYSVRLNVAYAPKVPVISVSQGRGSALEPHEDSPRLEAQKGQFLRLLCAAESRPPATLSWALEGRTLSQPRLSGSGGLELVLSSVQPGDEGHYSCRAENRLGFQIRTLDLSVRYAPENLTVTASRANRTVLENLRNGASFPVLEGQSLRLLCVTHSNPPASLSWTRGGLTLSPSQPSNPGVLELPRIGMEHEGEFICRAQNPLGSLSVSLYLSVQYPPQLLGPSCSWEDQGLLCSCSSRAQPAPSVRWRLGEGLLEGNHSNASCTVTSRSAGPWANSSLSLSGELSAEFSAGLRISCEARNVHGALSTAAVLLLPEKTDLMLNGFANGLVLGTGVTLLFLCLILVTMKILRTTQVQAETPAQARTQARTPAQVGTQAQAETKRPRRAKRSSMLDYINVVPNAGGLARNRKAKPSHPSKTSPEDANSPGLKLSPSAPESRDNEEELNYTTLSFPGLWPQPAQESKDTNSEYAEVNFH
ncbi:sialic acid-binding Ig-like lectin 10 [Molossus nigricans]